MKKRRLIEKESAKKTWLNRSENAMSRHRLQQKQRSCEKRNKQRLGLRLRRSNNKKMALNNLMAVWMESIGRIVQQRPLFRGKRKRSQRLTKLRMRDRESLKINSRRSLTFFLT